MPSWSSLRRAAIGRQLSDSETSSSNLNFRIMMPRSLIFARLIAPGRRASYNFGTIHLILAKPGRRALAVARVESHEVSLRQDTRQTTTLEHRQTSDLVLYQHSSGVGQWRLGSSCNHRSAHHVLDFEFVEHLAMRALAVPNRLRQRAAKQIALAHNAHHPVSFFIQHRQMTDASQTHHI